MRRAFIVGAIVTLAYFTCLAQVPPPPPSSPQSPAIDSARAHIEELKTKADHKGEADRGRIYADVAHELVELANLQFTSGDADKGHASIQEAVNYAEKAASSAEEKGHKIKNAEITLRETARRIEEVRKTLDIDDQPPLKAAVDRLEALRKKLLERMFGDDKK